jgi:hypothetical protein
MNKPVWGAAFAELWRNRDHLVPREDQLPRGDKGAYTDKQKRKAEHIEESMRSGAFPVRKPRLKAAKKTRRCLMSFSLSTVEYAQGATN